MVLSAGAADRPENGPLAAWALAAFSDAPAIVASISTHEPRNREQWNSRLRMQLSRSAMRFNGGTLPWKIIGAERTWLRAVLLMRSCILTAKGGGIS